MSLFLCPNPNSAASVFISYEWVAKVGRDLHSHSLQHRLPSQPRRACSLSLTALGYLLLYTFSWCKFIPIIHACWKRGNSVLFLKLYSVNSWTQKLGPSDTLLPRCPLRRSQKGKGCQQLSVRFYQVNTKDSCFRFLSKSNSGLIKHTWTQQ